MLRKRDGGQGQQGQLVPHDFEFNEAAIRGYLSTELPEGILVENITTLLQMNFIQVAAPKAGETLAHGTAYKITPPLEIRMPA